MTKTHTPLTIEGKIYVVVDAPAKPNLIYRVDYEHYNELLAACTRYETLPEHAPYWKERIGQRVEVVIGQFFKWNDGNYMNTCAVCSERFMHGAKRQPVCKPCCETTYAIPPQKDPLVNMIVTASVGTQSQHDAIQAHMDEYFKRWPSYKDRLTELEWYHLFLDFSDKLAIPPQQKQGDEWDEADKAARTHLYRLNIYPEVDPHLYREGYLDYLSNNYSITKK